MKIRCRKILLTVAAVSAAMAFAGCEPTDANKDYGFPKIYIPQATVTGLDNTYPVPNGPFNQNVAYTCYYEDGKLNIALGVVRAGALADQKAFTVDLSVSQSETDRKLSSYSEAGTPAMALPVDLCSIPGKISVPAGDNTGTCYLSVDFEKLALRMDELVEDDVYKLLVLGLEISNPTEYYLSETNTSVVVVIDLNDTDWDNVAENLPESEVRALFPSLSI